MTAYRKRTQVRIIVAALHNNIGMEVNARLLNHYLTNVMPLQSWPPFVTQGLNMKLGWTVDVTSKKSMSTKYASTIDAHFWALASHTWVTGIDT